LCTGAQGEAEAVLMRVATKEHPIIKLKKGDTVIFSSSVIPGNERTVQIMKDEILRQGAEVFHYKMMDIHAGGHAKKEELKKMIKIMKPRFFMPIHGQYSMLVEHAKIAKSLGMKEERIIVAENGDIVNLSKKKVFVERKRVPSNYVMVDGLGVGDVGEVVLRDRKMLAKDGIFVVIAVVDRQTGKVKGSPDIISRGFVYLRESKELLRDVRKRVIRIVETATGSGRAVNWAYVKNEIKEKIGQFLFSKTQRRPMVLPVVIEV
jgi:ribonuclease J